MTCLFVTGTDTGVGKTHVSAVLIEHWVNSGVKVGVSKPAESGFVETESDAVRLLAAAKSGQSLDEVCPYRLPEPLAPALAAKNADVTIDISQLAKRLSQLENQYDLVLVEGAGGLLVPLAEKTTYLDWIAAAKIPTLVISANRLGCINHTLLTLEALERRRVPVLGWILNEPSPNRAVDRDLNAAAISQYMDVPLLAEYPYMSEKEKIKPAAEKILAQLGI